MPELDLNKCRYLKDEGKQCQNGPRKGRHLCNEHSDLTEMDVEVFRAVTDHFNQDIREFFSRSNFYLVAQAALLSAFFTRKQPATNFEFLIIIGIVMAGLSVVVFWWRVAMGSVFWIKQWRGEVQRVSEELSRLKSYKNMEDIAQKNPNMSPENVTRLLPILFGVIWIVILVVVFLSWLKSTSYLDLI
jgi:hypothetical protein